MWYVAAFFAGALVDSIPVFAPPAWTVFVVMIMKLKLNPWGVVVAGTFGSVLGRWILTLYMPHVAGKILPAREKQNVTYVGKKLDQGYWKTSLFVLLYSITPLSTTALFTAAGMGKVSPLVMLPPFFIGKFASDAMMVLTGKYTAEKAPDLLHGKVDPKTLIMAGLGFILILATVLVDWQQLWVHKRLRLVFQKK